jgi:hypothetical protein
MSGVNSHVGVSNERGHFLSARIEIPDDFQAKNGLSGDTPPATTQV